MFDRRIIETKQQHVKLLIAKISIIGKIEEYKSKKKIDDSKNCSQVH